MYKDTVYFGFRQFDLFSKCKKPLHYNRSIQPQGDEKSTHEYSVHNYPSSRTFSVSFLFQKALISLAP